MKKLTLILAALCMSTAALATKPGNGNPTPPPFQDGGNGGAGGAGGNANANAAAAALASSSSTGIGVGVGVGGDAKAYGGSASAGVDSSISNSVRNDVSNANVNSVSNRNDLSNSQGQGQSQTAISGGNKLTNEGNNSRQTTNVNIAGDVTESSTPPVVPGVLPSVPTSCRLYLFGGGSTRDGAGSGTFPIGNDQTCLSIAKINLMERIGGFTQAEKQVVACKVEGMDDLPTCKALAAK